MSNSPSPDGLRFEAASVGELAAMLDEGGLDISLGEPLDPGAVSQIYAGHQDGQPVIVKYTSDALVADDPQPPFMPHQTHYLDTAILRYLADSSSVRVPEVIHAFDDRPLTIMEDLRDAGFTPLQGRLFLGDAPDSTGENTGHSVALVQQALGDNTELEPALPRPDIGNLDKVHISRLTEQQKVHLRFARTNLQLTWVDANPTNIFADPEGNIACIDFGFSNRLDRDFTLGCCLSYVAIFGLIGEMPKTEAADFITRAVGAYREILPMEDEVVTTYIASEVMDHSDGKWITAIRTGAQRRELLQFSRRVFNNGLFSLGALTSLLQTTR